MFLKLFFNANAFRDGGCYFGILILMLGVMTGPARGQDVRNASSPPEVAALSAVLMNPTTGEVLFAKEPRLRLPPASTTKVLTALVALERLDPNARVLVSPQAASAPPSRIGLRAGEAALTQDLLYGLMLKSGNDAAETLAEAAGGSIYGFAELMNAKAWQIGARDSHFMNPHGLPNDDHYTTAYDLALIFRQAMNNPMFADIVRTRNAALRIESGQGLYGDWRMVPVVNHNRLLGSYEGTLGGKTGFTFKARRCFVGEVDRGGVRLIVAVLNSPHSGALWNDARKLLDYGFAHYGLAVPPPAPLESPPMVARREPVTSPDEDEGSEPVAARPAPVTRVAMVRPAAREEVEAPTPNRSREPRVVRATPPVKPAVVARGREVTRPTAAAKPVAATKPVKPAKPMVLAAAKPMETPRAAKSTNTTRGKSAVHSAKPTTAASAKSEKRENTKVAAVRAESPTKPQKTPATKRRS